MNNSEQGTLYLLNNVVKIYKFLGTASRSRCGIGVSRGAYELISVHDSHRRYKGYSYKDFKNFRIENFFRTAKKCQPENAFESGFKKMTFVFFDHDEYKTKSLQK